MFGARWDLFECVEQRAYKSCGPGVFVVGRLLTMNSITSLVVGLLKFSLSSFWPCYLKFQIYYHTLFTILLLFICQSIYSYIPFLISDIVLTFSELFYVDNL